MNLRASSSVAHRSFRWFSRPRTELAFSPSGRALGRRDPIRTKGAKPPSGPHPRSDHRVVAWLTVLGASALALTGCATGASVAGVANSGSASASPTDSSTWWSTPATVVPALDIYNLSVWHLDQDGNPIVVGTPPPGSTMEFIVSTTNPSDGGGAAIAVGGYVGKTITDSSGPTFTCGLLSSLGVTSTTTRPVYGCVSKFNDDAESDGTYYLFMEVNAGEVTQTQIFKVNVKGEPGPQLISRR